jgi:hypothetical protein
MKINGDQLIYQTTNGLKVSQKSRKKRRNSNKINLSNYDLKSLMVEGREEKIMIRV